MLLLVCCGLWSSGYISNDRYMKEQQTNALYTSILMLVTLDTDVHDGTWLLNDSHSYDVLTCDY